MLARTDNYRPHYVYVIAETNDRGALCGPVKVGTTSSPNSRLASLQTGCARKLAIACVLEMPSKDTARDLEAGFHETQKQYRLAGEWFYHSPITAVQLLCLLLKTMLQVLTTLSEEDRGKVYLKTGAWHANQRALEEYVRFAWESAL